MTCNCLIKNRKFNSSQSRRKIKRTNKDLTLWVHQMPLQGCENLQKLITADLGVEISMKNLKLGQMYQFSIFMFACFASSQSNLRLVSRWLRNFHVIIRFRNFIIFKSIVSCRCIREQFFIHMSDSWWWFQTGFGRFGEIFGLKLVWRWSSSQKLTFTVEKVFKVWVLIQISRLKHSWNKTNYVYDNFCQHYIKHHRPRLIASPQVSFNFNQSCYRRLVLSMPKVQTTMKSRKWKDYSLLHFAGFM